MLTLNYYYFVSFPSVKTVASDSTLESSKSLNPVNPDSDILLHKIRLHQSLSLDLHLIAHNKHYPTQIITRLCNPILQIKHEVFTDMNLPGSPCDSIRDAVLTVSP